MTPSPAHPHAPSRTAAPPRCAEPRGTEPAQGTGVSEPKPIAGTIADRPGVQESRPSAQRAPASVIAPFLDAIRSQDGLRNAWRHCEVLPAEPGAWSEGLPAGYEGLEQALALRGIDALYRHQARALEHLEKGADVVLATPTASGKTLVYNLPVLRALCEGRPARALYLFPLRALERDQRGRLEADVRALGRDPAGVVEIYDGDTPQGRRTRIRKNPPPVLISTPDMLHAGILPRHAQWKEFFENLELVVIDELHSYRGVFGAHVAQVLRRLLRVAAHHGARPQIVAASATIANPGELAGKLTGHSFEVVQSHGAPQPERSVVLLNPDTSAYTAAARLFRIAVAQGLRTIVFTKARRVTELIHTWVVDAEPALRERVTSYRAGFLPEERREIEQRLFSGDLLGVISTSALEMGIDVGGLDVCILVGYPGSQIATWQRGGRVGRQREGAIVLVAQPDALDQYLVSHPRALFERAVELAVIDPHNPEIAAAHLPCAADEVPLRAGETWLQEPEAAANLARLEERGDLLRSEAGNEWFSGRRLPQRLVSLRQAGASYAIELDGDFERAPLIGTIGAGRVFAECHEGAVYLHRGRQYLVTELDPDEHRVRVRAVDVPWFTRTTSEKETEILTREGARPIGNFRLVRGRLRVTTRITGFERRRVHGQELLSSEPLDLPPTSIDTTGVWLEIPDEIPAAVKAAEGHPMGGLHAVEHATLGLFPLFALCDRHDVGGITTLAHPQVGRAAIFLYDGHAGGLGLATSLFERLETVLEATLELIEGCGCETGCPGCVHSPKCGSGNRPIDKTAAIHSLRWLLARDPLPVRATAAVAAPEPARDAAEAIPAAAPAPRIVFFDLETQRSAEEVGGWHNARLMRVSLAVTYETATGRFETWRERDVHRLCERLSAADLVIGFNVLRFDYQVLRGYTDGDLERLPTFDVLEAIRERIGFRLPLGHLAEENLGAAKGGDGLQALAWWKEGRVEEIERYCREDVRLLRDLFGRALEQGHLIFRTKSGDRVRIPTAWSVPEILERARSVSGSRARDGGRAPREARSRAARARAGTPRTAPR